MMSNRQLFLRHLGQTSEFPMLVEVTRADGAYLYGPNPEGGGEKRYLDLISGIGVSNVGHNAPEVVAAIQAQAADYLHTMVYGEFVMGPQAQFAASICAHLAPELDNVYFVNSGSEAVEGALKLSKKFTGRKNILAFHSSYHGSTHGALSVTGSPALKDGYGPFLPGVRFLQFNSYPDLAEIDRETACVIVEPVRGEAGVEPGHPCYLRALRERCTEMGALLVFDEVQAGFGRTGALFAHQRYRLVPDILLLGKALGGGMPLGAFVAPRHIMQVLTREPVLGHITTFGGHPVCCAAGLAAMKKILSENLVDGIPEREALVRTLLEIPQVREIRGRGMLFAVEIGDFDQVLAIIAICLAHGVVTDWFLHCNTAIRIAPPLNIGLRELSEGLEILRSAIQEVVK